jgi:hypothetical protein
MRALAVQHRHPANLPDRGDEEEKPPPAAEASG